MVSYQIQKSFSSNKNSHVIANYVAIAIYFTLNVFFFKKLISPN